MISLFNQNQVVYSLDTSALIAAFHERYPKGNFPGFWHNIEELIRNNRIQMSQIAFEEAMRNKEIKAWCNQNNLRQDLRCTVDELVQEKVGLVLSKFPRLIGNQKGRSGADPWVIALAMIAPNCVVVTEENPGSENKPKIPDVCAHFDVECIKIVDLIKREDWIFWIQPPE